MDVFCWVRLPDATTFPHKQASMMKAMVNRMSLLTFAGARAMQMSLPVESFGPQSWTCKAATRSLVASHVHLPQVRLFGVKPSDDDAEESWEPPSDYRVDDSHLSEDEIRSRKASIPDFSIVEDVPASTPSSGAHPAGKVPETKARRRTPNQMKTTSWMEKNEKFSVGSGQTSHSDSPARMDRRDGSGRREDQQNRTFREDFRGTRVFVQGLPLHATWQDVKDHFRIAGEVVFASVSKDFATGKSKGSGVVQFETTDMAKNATNVMRNYPLFGETLYVREDVQQRQDGAEPRNRAPLGGKQSTIPQTWTCGDERSTEVLTDQEKISVFSLIRARDEARKRRNYDASDDMREQLKRTYGVFVDDARKMWWVSLDGRTVPVGVKEVKGDGRWGALPPWRQIPTLPENDACVNPELVHGLLKQRDVARREKDFSTADALLEEARVSPDGELTLRIHDITRTWRVWTEKPPHRNLMIRRDSENNANEKKSPAEQCIDILTEHAPEKLEEVQSMLERYKGREFKILKELKQRYLS